MKTITYWSAVVVEQKEVLYNNNIYAYRESMKFKIFILSFCFSQESKVFIRDIKSYLLSGNCRLEKRIFYTVDCTITEEKTNNQT